MIWPLSINTGDFSIELPQIIQKVGFISDLLRGYEADEYDFAELLEEHREAVSSILHDIEDDLRTINETLYGKDKAGKKLVTHLEVIPSEKKPEATESTKSD